MVKELIEFRKTYLSSLNSPVYRINDVCFVFDQFLFINNKLFEKSNVIFRIIIDVFQKIISIKIVNIILFPDRT
jgi:hypothetical protein